MKGEVKHQHKSTDIKVQPKLYPQPLTFKHSLNMKSVFYNSVEKGTCPEWLTVDRQTDRRVINISLYRLQINYSRSLQHPGRWRTSNGNTNEGCVLCGAGSQRECSVSASAARHNTRWKRNPVSIMYTDAAIFHFKDIRLINIQTQKRKV